MLDGILAPHRLNSSAGVPITHAEVCDTDVSIDTLDVFVVIRWPAESGLPRYSFATLQHAAVIEALVERVQTCSTIEQAASLVDRLNAEEGQESKVA